MRMGNTWTTVELFCNGAVKSNVTALSKPSYDKAWVGDIEWVSNSNFKNIT